MPTRTDRGTVNVPSNSALISSEVNRNLAMEREDESRFRKSLFTSAPYVMNGLAASVTGTGLGVLVATGDGVDGNGYGIYIPATVPNTAVAFSLPAEGTAPQTTIAAAHATLARIDLVYLRAATLLTDYAAVQVSTDGGLTRTTQTVQQTRMTYYTLGVVTGTPAASPVAPAALLATDLVIAQVTVPAAAVTLVSGNVTDVRTIFGGVATAASIAAVAVKNGSPTEAYGTTTIWTGSTSSDGTTTSTQGSYGTIATIANGSTTITMTRDTCGNLISMTEA